MPIRQTYLDIADDLQARIGLGEYGPGAAIPSYREIAEMYSVGVSTAARAVVVLKARGVVRGESGRAVFVVDAPPSAR